MKKISQLGQKVYLKAGLVIATSTPFYAMAADGKLSDMFGNGTGIVKAVMLFVLAGVGLYGFIMAVQGIGGLMNTNPNESKLAHFGRFILGALLFSLMAIILAFNTEFIGGSTEASSTIDLIRGGS